MLLSQYMKEDGGAATSKMVKVGDQVRVWEGGRGGGDGRVGHKGKGRGRGR